MYAIVGWRPASSVATRLQHHQKPLKTRTRIFGAISLAIFAIPQLSSRAQSASAPAKEIRIVELQGAVEIAHAGENTWSVAQTNLVLHPLDRLRTGARSRVALHWSDESVVPFGPSTELEVLPPPVADAEPGLHLIRGIMSFFHRDKPGRLHIVTRGAMAGIEGTEFVMSVAPVQETERTTLSVIDGKVRLENPQGSLTLTNGEQAIAEPGSAPTRTPGFIANNLLQWCFYYPAVLDPADVQLTDDEQKALADSLALYRSGDLLAALAKYPADRQPGSDSEKIYFAALHLSVGQVEQTEAALATLSTNNVSDTNQRLAAALRRLIAAVKRTPNTPAADPQLTTEFLANSYYEQSRAVRETSLTAALFQARQAATHSPQFGFAWERVAELEFSFGRMGRALDALEKSLALSPRNAQALALKGFILSARNEPREAIVWFDRAIAADAALGNAWLGRGIARIRTGDKQGGREDLMVAAALEPQRAELRSYLGKAYTATPNDVRAEKELALAKKLDPNDPTAWLYSALENQQANKINDSIRDLEKSKELNDNRSVYRSQLLLDQDQAVRSANLAGMYRDAGMFDVSVQEAGRAVSYDYADYSAHLFLASSYDQLRDPTWSNLRYEVPANREYLTANLLAPVGAGPINSLVADRPYAALFGQNKFGVASETTYLSRGAWTEHGIQFGTFDNFNYSFEAKYRFDPGQHPNNDSERRDLVLNLKEQLTLEDSVFASIEWADINEGDVNEYYKGGASPTLRYHETQDPNLFLGYHHEWSPGVHTLFFASRFTADSTLNADAALPFYTFYNGAYQGVSVEGATILNTLSTERYSMELQQIWEHPNHTTVLGGAYGWGETHRGDYEALGGNWFWAFNDQSIARRLTVNDQRASLYGYHNWRITDWLMLDGGLTYDNLHMPNGVTSAPFNSEMKTINQVSPKAGLIWTPGQNTTFRAAYTRSLSGVFGDQNQRIEPTEVAGFNQSYRSIIPDTVVGEVNGAQFDTYDISLEQKCDTGTYLSVAGELLYSANVQRTGAWFLDWDVYDANGDISWPTAPTGVNQSLDYRERSIVFTADQLLGQQWSAGARYRISQADLSTAYKDIAKGASIPGDSVSVPTRSHFESVLHTVNLHLNWNHPCGVFSILEGNWYHQSNSGFSPAEPGDDFWQLNAYAGYRFWHRRAEATIGLLNITDQNYRLEPLNLYNEMARSRTLLARLRIYF